jgi:endonuclease/exonuclease/phosphatase (EEP) superfamily protein YafD
MIWARFTRDGRAFTVAGTHLDRPPTRRHLRQIASLPAMVASLEAPIVLVGDFNATPWSYALTRVIGETGLAPLAGLRPTWPAHLGWPQLPIDHVLVSGEWRLLSAERGPYAGSDHRPVIARLALGSGE